MSIKKAVVPVAGFATRFLPACKATPKCMLNIVDKPIIQYIVEEAVESRNRRNTFNSRKKKRSNRRLFFRRHRIKRISYGKRQRKLYIAN